MKIKNYTFEPIEILDRVCKTYGFHQKVQLADYFEISASSLSNRYSRGTISYDFAAVCALETGASLEWLLTGEGEQFSNVKNAQQPKIVPRFTLSEERLLEDSPLSIDPAIFSRPISKGIGVRFDGKLHFIDQDAALSDGLWLIDIDEAISIREITKLPGKRLHITGGKVPFECSVDDITTLGRVVGIYSEVD